MGALSGVRVLDLTHVLNGPFCTVLLAHMGAEVLKIEYGEGDRFRHAWMPVEADHDGYEFLHVNSNKKGVWLDLKLERGKELFKELVRKSDVLVENFTTGVMDRLDLGYEELCKINPRLIYACSRGFGESGPYRDVRANAATISAITGTTHNAMRVAGVDGIKSPSGSDEIAGASLCIGIVSALFSRERTGRGQKVEVSMQEAQLGFMTSALHTHFEGQEVAGPPKPCADGYYAFHMPDTSDVLWANMAKAFGRESLIDDPRFRTKQDRRKNYPQMEEEISAMVRENTRDHLWKILSEFGLSSAPVLTVEEALQDAQLKARDAVVEVDHPQAGKVALLAPWIRFSETPGAITSPAPLVGQHTREVLAEVLGKSSEELDELERSKIIAQGAER